MTIGIPDGHFLFVIPLCPPCHPELVEGSLSKKFKTFQKEKNFLS